MAAIDPTKVGKYPVILSPELLGKPSKETYTGIRYNHRPTLSSDTAPNTAHLKKSAKDGSYNLGFDDKGDRYQYNGVRTTEDGNYALIFDPKRQAFILHRVDSMFHMNLTRTPTDNVETLRVKFPQLEIKNSGSSAAAASKPPPTHTKGKVAVLRAPASTKAKPAAKSAAAKNTPAANGKGKGNVGKKAAEALTLPDPKALTLPDPKALTLPDPKAAPLTLSLPMPSIPEKKREPPPPPPKKKIDDDEDDEDDDDDDFGLTIEYPDAKPPPPPSSYPAASLNRRFSEFGKGGYKEEEEHDPEEGFRHFQQLREEDDEDEEYDFEEVVPTQSAPVSSYNSQPRPPVDEPEVYTFDDGDDSEEEADTDPMNGVLEAELEAAFGEIEQEDKGGESEVSEEE